MGEHENQFVSSSFRAVVGYNSLCCGLGVVIGGRGALDIMISFVVWTKTDETATNVFRQLSGTRWDTIFTAEVWKPVSTVGTPRGFFNFCNFCNFVNVFNFFNFLNFYNAVNIFKFVRGVRVVTQRAQGGI